MITGGIDDQGKFTASAELFNYRDNTHRLITQYALGVKDGKLPPYPRQVLTDNPDVVFFTGVAFGGYTGRVAPMFWNFRTGATRQVAGLRSPTQRASAASCFFGDADDGRIMVMGGGPTANNLVDIIDIDSAQPRYRPAPGLRAKKDEPELPHPADRVGVRGERRLGEHHRRGLVRGQHVQNLRRSTHGPQPAARRQPPPVPQQPAVPR